MNGKDFYFNTIKPSFEEGLSYGEILKNPPAPLKYFETNFLLSPDSLKTTELTFVIRAKLKWKLQYLLLPVIKSKMKLQANKVINGLKEAVISHSEKIQADFDSITEEAALV